MSLRYQINIRILLSSFCILLLGGGLAIWQARSAVQEEVQSSISLAVQLITIGFAQAPSITMDENTWLAKLNSLKQTRHLNIQLQEPSGQIISFAQKTQANDFDDTPPQWFIDFVKGKHPKVEHSVISGNGQQFTLIIQANPMDEIIEVWQESVAFFSSVFLLTLLTVLAVNVVFNKALRSIATIVDGLKVIETGQYQQQLPEFSITEYDSIAKAINHMTGELATAQQQNRALTQHSLEIQEDERQHLALELHDELGQSLTAIKVMAVTSAHKNANIQQTTQSITGICDHLISVVRSMMQHLHPLMLTELGLKATLEDLVNHWAMRSPNLKIQLTYDDAADQLPTKISIQIFRVIQECLTNTLRHAKASQATIRLGIEKDAALTKLLKVQVSDNGLGCDLHNIKSGFGLLSMKERIHSLGGEFNIKSSLTHGMTITAKIPLK
jgi:two-component system sensor histidine kinase UhpB